MNKRFFFQSFLPCRHPGTGPLLDWSFISFSHHEKNTSWGLPNKIYHLYA